MRASGILMHISSLPSPYGIGTLGAEARRFVDFLVTSGQTYWQVLPTNPPGFGDSPYQALSSFAGNHNFIDLDTLIAEGLLHESEVRELSWGEDPTRVDFDCIYRQRLDVLKLAYNRFICTPNRDFLRFVAQEKDWLREYALFMAIKEDHAGAGWFDWDQPQRNHDLDAIREAAAATDMKHKITFHYFLQYEFFRQWNSLHEYCRQKGVTIIGDVPIYVPLDSCDVWVNADLFQLDEARIPTAVAGCPPDQFNEDGQLWGNPIYDWQAMRASGYDWWIRRLAAASRIYDVIRIDHFRGFESYWAVPYGAPNAREGEWKPGPGLDFVQTLRRALPTARFIAEDLGFLTPAVKKLREASGFPGMKVLEFAFDTDADCEYLPHFYVPDCVCYTGTHDNAPLLQWYEELSDDSRAFARRYLALTQDEGVNWGIIRGGMSSVAALFIAQMQDYLPPAITARMNEPGRVNDKNWRWRLTPDALTPELSRRIKAMTMCYARAPAEKGESAPAEPAPMA